MCIRDRNIPALPVSDWSGMRTYPRFWSQDYIASVARKVTAALDAVNAARMEIQETGLAKQCIQ
eukprot:7993107-Pyramimonas_sp.AAC.1